MADLPNKQETEAFQKAADQLRSDLESGFAFVEGQRYTQAALGITLEERMDQQIERLVGKPPNRPCTLDRLKRMKAKLDAGVEKARAMAPEMFVEPDPNKNVNTR